jgi:hypothetical protein
MKWEQGNPDAGHRMSMEAAIFCCLGTGSSPLQVSRLHIPYPLPINHTSARVGALVRTLVMLKACQGLPSAPTQSPVIIQLEC